MHDYLGLWKGRHAGSHPSCALPSSAARKPRAKPAPRPASSTVRVSKSAEKGGLASTATASMRGKLIKGKKRHVLVDTQGLSAARQGVTASGDVQDRRDGGLALLAPSSVCFAFWEIVRRQRLSGAMAGILGDLETGSSSDPMGEGLRRPAQALGGRTTIAWLNRCRRLAKDWENLNRNALSSSSASIRLGMLRKLCNPT